jgi:ectoine hydroxylase-related dioxygenase (phytanoyl-CoA dioxygenase family)
MALVNATDIESFKTDGFVVLHDVLPLSTLETLQQGVEKNLSFPSHWANDYTPENSSGRFFDDYVSWQRISEFKESALHTVLPRIAGELMSTSSPRFFHEHVLVKEPGTATPTPWHHDDPYYGIEGMNNVSLWVPLDSVPKPIALRFIRGSHLVPRRFIPNRFVDDSPYTTAAPGFELFPTSEELEELGDTVVCPAEPGDVVAFHFRTLHCAPGTTNHSSRRRVVSFRYVGDDVRWTSRPWKTSPPFEPQGLNDGDELDEIRFPLIAL